MGFIYFVIIVVFILILFFMFSVFIGSSNAKADFQRKQNFKAQQKEDLEKITIPVYNNLRSELVYKYGTPTKTIVIKRYHLDKEIIAFEESKRVWICGKDLSMESILSCSLEHNKSVTRGEVISTTKTNNGSMVKRAVVGNVVMGGAGAIIGGSTAGKTTVSTQGTDRVSHNYSVIINIDSLYDPIIRPYSGRNDVLANEIVGLMNVIINRNKRVVVERIMN